MSKLINQLPWHIYILHILIYGIFFCNMKKLGKSFIWKNRMKISFNAQIIRPLMTDKQTQRRRKVGSIRKYKKNVMGSMKF